MAVRAKNHPAVHPNYRDAQFMIRSLRSFLIAATALLACTPAFAQLKVGLVNLDRLIREAPAAVSAQKRLQQEFQPREKELASMSDKIKAAQDNLAKNGLQRKQQAFQEDLTQRRNEALSGLIEQANRVVRQVAQAEKYDVIFQEAVYWSPSIDLTEKIMKMLVEQPGQK